MFYNYNNEQAQRDSATDSPSVGFAADFTGNKWLESRTEELSFDSIFDFLNELIDEQFRNYTPKQVEDEEESDDFDYEYQMQKEHEEWQMLCEFGDPQCDVDIYNDPDYLSKY